MITIHFAEANINAVGILSREKNSEAEIILGGGEESYS
jgi:hypothetical protein